MAHPAMPRSVPEAFAAQREWGSATHCDVTKGPHANAFVTAARQPAAATSLDQRG
jgi:hypothetical protein